MGWKIGSVLRVPQLAKIILDATPGGIECTSDCDRQIIGLLPVDRDVRTGHTEIDPHVERASSAVVMNRVPTLKARAMADELLKR